MKITLNIKKRHLVLLSLMILLGTSLIVIAQTPPSTWHSLAELSKNVTEWDPVDANNDRIVDKANDANTLTGKTVAQITAESSSDSTPGVWSCQIAEADTQVTCPSPKKLASGGCKWIQYKTNNAWGWGKTAPVEISQSYGSGYPINNGWNCGPTTSQPQGDGSNIITYPRAFAWCCE